MSPSEPNWNQILKTASIVIHATQDTKVEPYHLAEKNRAEAAARSDYAGMRLWRDVWVYLMAKKYLLQGEENKIAA
jgi:hypothetical protein